MREFGPFTLPLVVSDCERMQVCALWTTLTNGVPVKAEDPARAETWAVKGMVVDLVT